MQWSRSARSLVLVSGVFLGCGDSATDPDLDGGATSGSAGTAGSSSTTSDGTGGAAGSGGASTGNPEGAVADAGRGTDASEAPATDAGGAPGDGNVATLTDAQRFAVLDAITAEMHRVADQAPAAVDAALLAFLQHRPELVNVGIEGDVIAADFIDGRWIALFHNFVDSSLVAPTAQGSPIAPASERTRTAAAPAAIAAAELPASNKAHLFSVFSDTGPLSGVLGKRGWKPTQNEATLDALRGQSGDGFFFIHTHGGVLPARPVDAGATTGFIGRPRYALLTSTPATAAAESSAILQDDLRTGRVGYTAWPSDSILRTFRNVLGLDGFFYGISAGFAQKEWKFARPAVAYVAACTSAGSGATELASAMKAGGVSLYVGWSDEVDNRINANGATYLVDRLLGANTFNPESPNQRPFDFGSVETDMSTKGLSRSNVKGHDGVPRIADLTFVSDGKAGLLAPSIERMTVDVPPVSVPATPSKELVLDGLFGSTAGTVSIGGAPVAVHSWNAHQIKVDLPAAPGAGYDGDVMVKVNEIESNSVPLTSWHPQMTYVDNPLSTAFPNEKMTVLLKVAWRADLHASRSQAGQPPMPPSSVYFVAAPDSKVTYSATGTDNFSVAPFTCTTTGAGEVPYGFTGFGAGYALTGFLAAPSSGARSSFGILASVPDALSTSCDGDITKTWLALDPDVCPPNGAPFDLSGGFTMMGDTRTTTQLTNIDPSLRWSSVDAVNPPDASKGEDTKH